MRCFFLKSLSGTVKSVLVELANALEGLEGWGLFAGAANVFYGVDHPVNDLDFFYDLKAEQKLLNALHSFKPCKPFLQKKASMTSKKFGFLLNGFEIEFCADFSWSFAGKMSLIFDSQMQARINWFDFENAKLPVLSAEDNIVLKAILQRGKEYNKTDIEDVKGLLKNNNLDFEYIRQRAIKCNAEQRVTNLIENLQSGLA